MCIRDRGYENAPTVMLQGHMDMVCEKTPDSSHDFTKDALKLQVEGDFISAQGTTLGGDDGIAVAYGLALLEDETLEHPALEVVITVDEEIGLLGATALNAEPLQAKYLINLDSEEEGYLWACLLYTSSGCRDFETGSRSSSIHTCIGSGFEFKAASATKRTTFVLWKGASGNTWNLGGEKR